MEYFRHLWHELKICSYHWDSPSLIIYTQQLCCFNQRAPRLSEIAETWASLITDECQNGCLEAIFTHERQEIIMWMLLYHPSRIYCGSIHMLKLFRDSEHCFPTSIDHLVDFCRNIVAQNPLDLELLSEDKVYVGTKNLEHLPTAVTTDDKHNCGICQDTIAANTDVYVIPGCGHQFHCIEQECLLCEEDPSKSTGILNWLRDHHTCPLCSCDVQISAPSDSKT